jgi:putative membrane protein
MDKPEKPAEQDPRVYFAAERTFLAWIRTGLGLMGVGFAVSRFGLFLRQLNIAADHAPNRATAHSVVAGVALVVLGVVVNLAAVISHIRITRQLATGTWQPGKVSRLAVALGLLLAAVGVAMAVYLLLVK